MHPVLEQKQALPDARYYLQLALRPVAVHIERPASLYTTQHAHQPFLDLVPFHHPTRQFFLALRSRGQIFHRPPLSLCLGFTRLLQSLADLQHMPAKAGQSHAMARQVAHHPFRIADRPQRPSKHQSVEATQHSRNPLRMSCYKLFHGASLLPRCSVLAERQHLIENRSACHFWLRLCRAVLSFSEFNTENREKSQRDLREPETAIKWCRGGELNSLRRPFQGRALPVSYPGTGAVKDSTVALQGCQCSRG